MRLARVVSNQSRAVLVIVALLCAAGMYAVWQLPVAVFPETDFPRIVIIVDNGEAPAAQTLASVTRPIEEAMNGVPGIARIKSKTARGSSEISLYFDWRGNVLQELQLVQARVSQLAPTLPPTAKIRNVERLTFAVFPVVGYSLTSDTRDAASLRDVANYIIRPRLARLPGIATVGVAGGKVREFHVTISPDRLVAHSVSAQQVVDAVRNSNVIESPGLIEENHQLELALISGQAKKPEELNSSVVATVNNAPVLLSDVASVGAGVEPPYTLVTGDRHPATLDNINRQPDANTVAVVEEVKTELASSIGLVIDDAIVVVENIYTHINRGESRREAVRSAISEVTVPIIGSTITPVVVFLPLTLLTGVTGVFFRSLALTMAVALLTSLVLALTFTPVLAERFVKLKPKRRDESEPPATTEAEREMQAELEEEGAGPF